MLLGAALGALAMLRNSELVIHILSLPRTATIRRF
jgi:hypothetical protein